MRKTGKKVENKRVLRDFNNVPYAIKADCPVCDRKGLISTRANYCENCGQKLDWN